MSRHTESAASCFGMALIALVVGGVLWGSIYSTDKAIKLLSREATMESNCTEKTDTSKTSTLDDFYSAIAKVETNGTLKRGAAGEIGTYQITEAYWIDSGVEGEFEMCWNDKYSQDVMYQYWRRYCMTKLGILGRVPSKHFEVLARIHNGGPRGMEKESTVEYWEKVKAVLHAN